MRRQDEDETHPTSRKFRVVEDFDDSSDTVDVPTIDGRYVSLEDDKVIVTGWKLGSHTDDDEDEDEEAGVTDFIPSGKRYYMSKTKVKKFAEEAKRQRRLNKRSVIITQEKERKRAKVYVSSNSIWTANPEEPIFEESTAGYDCLRNLFWVLFFILALIGTAILSCNYMWSLSLSHHEPIIQATSNLLKDNSTFPKYRELCNIHALISTTAITVNLGFSILIYRMFPYNVPYKRSKTIHGTLGFIAVIGVVVGCYFAWEAATHLKYIETGIGVHSVVGYLTASVVILQFMGGISLYLLPSFSFETQVNMYPLHKFLGQIAFLVSVTATTTGVITMGRLFIPLDHYAKRTPSALTLNLVGFMTLVLSIVSSILVNDNRFRRRRRPDLQILKADELTELARAASGRITDEKLEDEETVQRLIIEDIDDTKDTTSRVKMKSKGK